MDLLTILFLIGITVEAMTGALAAGRRSMDLFGVMFVGCITALGGGTVRDIVLNAHPLTWIEHPPYISVTAVASLVTVYIFSPYMLRLRGFFLALDALGLSVFTVVGVKKAIFYGHDFSIAIFAGIITGIFGGVMRDILCDDIPLIFKSELYASVALVTGILYILLIKLMVPDPVAVIITLFFGFALRMLAICLHWNIPKFEYQN
ncbi:MAG: trimeric intracellular cation channel family protein [Endozoicomonadaceae bacterium]|nr:trimeric intracellular cation channel family protein [Endozoicomonadaceae bacterium]MBE8233720.1 trimeric intracellular cation channel family protein [Endozoicomonadaceae bacterium]